MPSKRPVHTSPPPGVDLDAILSEEAHRAAVGLDRRAEVAAGERVVVVKRDGRIFHRAADLPCAPKGRHAIHRGEAAVRREGYRPCPKCLRALRAA